ncbi:MAG: hypothetical protein LAP38_19490 [Acidobacteriia bacterium]|nr:hypothetical protein [Terriglobia bacterium]
MKGFLITIGISLLAGTAWSQTLTVTQVVTAGLLDSRFAPTSLVYVLGSFPQGAGRDYSITVGGETGPVTVADNQVFITALIPSNAPLGAQTLTVHYLGQSSNAFPITLSAYAPEFSGGGVTINGPTAPPAFGPYTPFQHANSRQAVTPISPAAPGEPLVANLYGLGPTNPPTPIGGFNTPFSPLAVTPTLTIGGQNIQIARAGSSTGILSEIDFIVPNDAPLGIDQVIVAIPGFSSNTAVLPVGSGPAIGSVLNGASFGSTGVVAPGSIVSIFGAGFGTKDNNSAFPATSVNGATVQFGAIPAPIFALAATQGQINVLVPNELPTSGTVNLTVQTGAGVTPEFPINLAPAAPGMFFFTDPLNPLRRNAAAVVANTAWIAMPLSMAAAFGIPSNCAALSAGTLCGQPAHPGDYLQIYVTGLGKATPNGDPAGAVLATGSVAPASGNPLYETVSTPSVVIGGLPATVVFSGIAPNYAGLYQVDVQIPAAVTSGDDVPIQISMPGSATDSASIAIRP